MSLVHRPRVDLVEHEWDSPDEEPRDDPAQRRRDEDRRGQPEPPDEPRQREPEAERQDHPGEDLDVIHVIDRDATVGPTGLISAPSECSLV